VFLTATIRHGREVCESLLILILIFLYILFRKAKYHVYSLWRHLALFFFIIYKLDFFFFHLEYWYNGYAIINGGLSIRSIFLLLYMMRASFFSNRFVIKTQIGFIIFGHTVQPIRPNRATFKHGILMNFFNRSFQFIN